MDRVVYFVASEIRSLEPVKMSWKGTDHLPDDNTEILETPAFNVVATGDVVVACLSGRIDMDFSPVFLERLVSLMKSRRSKTLSIDLSGITHMDSSGIATLIEGLKIARLNGIDLRLQGLQGRILRLFEVTGILSLFNGSIRK